MSMDWMWMALFLAYPSAFDPMRKTFSASAETTGMDWMWMALFLAYPSAFDPMRKTFSASAETTGGQLPMAGNSSVRLVCWSCTGIWLSNG
jgi:hypothetical protein